MKDFLLTKARDKAPSKTANSIWWSVPDLNRSPRHCERRALPDELTPQLFNNHNHPQLFLVKFYNSARTYSDENC